MRPNLITRLKKEWNNLDPVDPLRGLISDAIDALAEQPAQQEPVAWVCYGWASDEKHAIDYEQHEIDAIPVGTLLYTFPPASKPWVGLTDEDIQEIRENCGITHHASRHQDHRSQTQGEEHMNQKAR